MQLAEAAAGLVGSFTELPTRRAGPRSVTIRTGTGTVRVAETEVVLHRPARHYTGERTASGSKKQVEVPGPPCRCGWWSRGWSTKPGRCWPSGGC